jgi:hypothetical protein
MDRMGSKVTGNSIDLTEHRPIVRGVNAVTEALHRRPTLLLFLVAIVLPNALFLGAILAGVGTPPRSGAIIAYFTAAVIARVFGRGIGIAAFLFVLIFDVINTISLLFGLSFLEIAATLGYARELKLFQSPLYIALGVGLFATAGLVLWILATSQNRLREARLLPVLLAMVALVVLDYGFNTSMHYHFGSAFAAGQPFDSAVKRSGFEAATTASDRPNLLLVMIEGMGEFADPEHQAVLAAPFDDPALLRRYTVTRGETTYFGSTTAAEMRELCGTRDHHTTLLEAAPGVSTGKSPCLPERLARRGYRTIGIHGFTGAMFERHAWWPKIGLQTSIFGEQLVPPLPVCGAVFKGACDPAVGPTVRDRLAGQGDAKFVYWLTLNTHIPVRPGEHSGRLACADGGPFDVETVCHMVGMWRDVFREVIRVALDPNLPPTEILIIGDHAPPLWSRADRALFAPGRVSWFRLAVKDRSVASAPETATSITR